MHSCAVSPAVSCPARTTTSCRRRCWRRWLSGIVPGDYDLVTDRGQLARVAIDGPSATAGSDPASGTARLVVQTAPGRRLHLVPAGAGPLLRLMAARVAELRAPASGELAIGPLAPGEYEICATMGVPGLPVLVMPPETRIRVD